jgi:uncharacterized membrane protein
MKNIKVYQKNKNIIYLAIFSITILIILLGCLVYPHIFYDQWIWKYYWGPIVADANPNSIIEVYNGVQAHEGYTLISEITYGLILIIALFFIYKLLKKLKIVVDWKFALALMPYILFGPISRTLEDAGFFTEPVVYFFISPLIYFQIAAYAVVFLLLGHLLEKKYNKKYLTVNNILFSSGVIFFLSSLITLIFLSLEIDSFRFDVLIFSVCLVSIVTFIVYLVSYIFRKNEKIVVYKNPLNIAIIFGHLLDGITSYISIKDPLNMGLSYAEKHPASNLLLELWGPLFPIVKFLLVIIIIYVFDILYKDELKSYKILVNLLKIGILILGFSPGLRDLLRVTIGV